MTQLIVEGFATYGIGTYLDPGTADRRNALLAGAWADCPQQFNLGLLPFAPQDTAIYIGGTFWLSYNSGSSTEMLRRTLPAARTEIVVSMRYAVGELPSLDNACRIVAFMAGAPSINDLLLIQQSNGYLVLRRNGVTLASTQSSVIVAGSPVLLEMKFNAATGAFELRVDGVAVITAAGLTVDNTITQLAFIGKSSASSVGGSVYMTDLIIRDTAGSYNNGFMGDRRVATLMVNRDDAAHQGWTPRPLQRFGNAILDNSGAGSSGGVYCAATTATDLGNGDYTIEGNFRFSALPTGSNKAQLFGKWQEDNNQRSYRMYLAGPLLDAGMLVFQISTDGTNGTVNSIFTWPWKPKTGQWYHIAVCRSGGQLRVFVDGVILGLAIADANTYFAGSARTAVMAQCNNNPPYVSGTRFSGWQDEFRLTKGVARYTANFAPPTAAFPRGAGDPSWANVQWLSGWENGIFDDSSAARTLTAYAYAANGDAVPTSLTPNDGGAAYRTLNKKTPPLDFSFIEAALVPATGLFTLSAQPANGETVTVGTTDGSTPAVYKFVTVLAAAYDVLIGADANASLVNLASAINKSSGEGTTYGTGTAANFNVSGTKMPTTQLLATALVGGAAGNSIASTDTVANGSWGAATLTGGADIPPYSQFGFERPPNFTTVIDSVTLVVRAWKTDSGPAKVRQSFVAPGGALADGTEKNVSTNPTLYFDTFEVDPDTSAPLTPTTIANGLMKINRTV